MRLPWPSSPSIAHGAPCRAKRCYRPSIGADLGGDACDAGTSWRVRRPQLPWALPGGPYMLNMLRLMLGRRSPNASRWSTRARHGTNGPAKSELAYFQELDRLGYIEGKNLIVEFYSVLGRHDRTEEIARAVVASRPDLIFAQTGALTRALKPLTATIPILAITGDPVAGGIVKSLANSGGNITGVSVDPGLGIYGKRFQFLVETARRPANVRFLMTTTGRWLWETKAGDALRDPASWAGISIDAALVSTPVDQAAYEQVFEAMEKDRVDGLIVSDASDHLAYRHLIVDLAARYRLPAIYCYQHCTGQR